MKIVLFGAKGQVGSEICDLAEERPNLQLITTDVPKLDICDPLLVSEFIRTEKPEVIINCAAFTAVDRAETEKDRAFQINHHGAAHIAWAARSIGAHMLHVSTDYVYGDASLGELSGNHTDEDISPTKLSTQRKFKPLTEGAPTDPLNEYGKSKLAGDNEVLHILPESAAVVRTSSVHGQYGANFVQTMVKLFRENSEVRVVNDQFMSPTWARWLGDVLLDLAATKPQGLFHACSRGVISWFEFAEAIHRQLLRKEPNNNCKLIAIPSSEFVKPARRPQFSAMDCTKLSTILGRPPITWEAGLDGHLRDLGIL